MRIPRKIFALSSGLSWRLVLSKMTVAAPPILLLLLLEVWRINQLADQAGSDEYVRLGCLLGVGLMASFVLALRRASNHIRVLQELAEAVEGLNAGSRKVRVDANLPGELGRLASACNSLAESLRKSEAKGRAANRSFQRIFEALPVPASLYSGDLKGLVQVNDAFCRTYRMRRDELIGHTLGEFNLGLTQNARPLFREPLEAHGKVTNLAAQVRGPGTRMRHVLTSAEFIWLQGEKHVLSIEVDVTDRIAAEEQLRERQQQLDGVVETALDAVVTLDEQGRIVVFNDSASRLFGVPRNEALGCSPERFVAPGAWQTFLALFRAIRRKPALTRRLRRPTRINGVRRDGSLIPLEVALSTAGEGARRTFTAILRDETEKERAEAAILESERAIAANQAKTQFLSRMSHELRTPLNAVMGFMQLLRESTGHLMSPEQLRQLNHVNTAGRQLTALIEDVLDLSRIEAGKLSVELKSVNVRTILGDVVHLLEPQAKEHGLTLHHDCSHDNRCSALADAMRLQQVLMNVMTNAIKYNVPGGEVRLTTFCDNNDFVIEVADTGCGMSVQQLAHVFEPFNRLGREKSSIPGTGIGLALSHQLMALMNGQLALASAPGQGTTVTMRLPCSFEEPTALERTEESAPTVNRAALGLPTYPGLDNDAVVRGRVLYIEDTPFNAVLVQSLFSRFPDVKLTVAETGQAGIEQAYTGHPQLILLDMHLPDMEGLQVMERLKADTATRTIPVVSVSANAMLEDVRAALRAGARDYWTKPIDFDLVLSGTAHWLNAKKPA